MAGSKEATDRPSYHAVGNKDIVAVDRKTFRSDVWEHFGWHRKAIWSSWVVCNRCCAGFPERATTRLTCNIT